MSAAPATAFGARPKLEWLPVQKLAVDHRYQRTLDSDRSQALIARIAAKFRWSAFQAILATPRQKADGGGWLVLDGQHRVAAAKLCGIDAVPSVVVDAASLEEQAAAFVQSNLDRVTVNPYALYHAKLVGGDEAAGEIARLCKRAGIAIPRKPLAADHIGAGETLALGTLAAILRQRGPAQAALAVGAVAEAYRDEPGALRANIFLAAAALVAAAESAVERPEVAKRITAALRRLKPAELALRAAKRKVTHGMGERDAILAILRAELQLERAAAQREAAGDSFIKTPTRAQLMGSR